MRTVLIRGSLVLVSAFISIVVFSYWYVENYGRSSLYELADIPNCKVALVLGTSPKLKSGKENPFFNYRIDKAFELWKSGKVQYLLLSGDNSNKYYNEPQFMQTELIKRGVPQKALILDFAGVRTFDSVIRAKEVFGQNQLIIISQEFHVKRAIVIANHFNMKAYGLISNQVDFSTAEKTYLREVFARIKLMLDLYILNTSPGYLGEPVIID